MCWTICLLLMIPHECIKLKKLNSAGVPPLPLSTCVVNQGQHTAGILPTPNITLIPQGWGEYEGGPGYWDVMLSQGCAFTSGKYFSNVQVNPVVDLECGNKSLESVGLQGSSTDSSGGADFGSHVNNLSLKKVPNFVGSENNGHNPHFEKGIAENNKGKLNFFIFQGDMFEQLKLIFLLSHCEGESSKIMANENTEANDPMDSSGTDFSMRAAPPLNLCLTITGSGEQGGSRTPINLEDSASDVGVGKGGC